MGRRRHPSGETLADDDYQVAGPIRNEPRRHGNEVLVAEELGQILLVEVQIELLDEVEVLSNPFPGVVEERPEHLDDALVLSALGSEDEGVSGNPGLDLHVTLAALDLCVDGKVLEQIGELEGVRQIDRFGFPGVLFDVTFPVPATGCLFFSPSP